MVQKTKEPVAPTPVETRVENWPLDLIDDNPFNPRTYYNPKRVQERADSIERNGQLHTPKARLVDGRAQVAFGGYRRRAFLKLRERHKGKKFTTQPLEILDLDDDQMIRFALDENLNRDDNSPIEIARAVDGYIQHFPEVSETKMAEKLGMTQGHVSNMLRVLTLPAKILEKIDEGRISFTMGRELLVLKGLNSGSHTEWSRKEKENVSKEEDDEYLMLEAIKGVRGPESNDRYGSMEPPTVDGIKKAIHQVVARHFKSVDNEELPGFYSYYSTRPLFSCKDAGCHQCEKMIRTHPTKSTTGHYCTDEACWTRHQDDHRTRMAAEAVAKRQADLQKLAAEKAREIQETISEEMGVEVPKKLFRIRNNATEKFYEGGDIEAASVLDAINVTGWDPAVCEVKEQTKGEYSTGWRKVKPEEYAGTAAVEIDEDEVADILMEAEADVEDHIYAEDVDTMDYEDKVRRARHIRSLPEGYPCKTCLNCMTCDGTFARSEEGGVVCRHKVTKSTVEERLESAKVAIPEDLKPALEAAGTRGVIVDLHGLWQDSYSHENITGYVRLDNILDEMEDSEECTERCTKGFHYAFDSKDHSPRTYMICEDKKCVAKKKAAFTRARNAKNNAKKNAERAAFKQAVEVTTEIDKPRMKLILYAQVHGNHVQSNYSWQNNEQLNWLANQLKVEVKGTDREKGWKIVEKAIDKLPDIDLARVVVGFMLTFLTYQGRNSGYYGSDRSHQDYKIQTTEALNWLGVGVTVKEPEKGGEK